MAEGHFEPYHVPQRSRRDKLRVGECVDNLQLEGVGAGLLPLYEPSSSSLLISQDLLTCATLHPNHNQTSYQDLNNYPFFYAPQNLNHHSFNIDATQNHQYTSNYSSTNQGLSLSLSSSHHHNNNNMYGGGGGDNDKVTVGYLCGGSTSGNHNMSRNHNDNMSPLGPYVGYSTILKESRFLKPAEQLLRGICDVGCGIYADKIPSSSPFMDPPPFDDDDHRSSADVVGDGPSKKSRLIALLEEVYRRYKHYYQQVQAVVASFDTVPGLSNAAPYAHLALKTMSKHFGYVKNAITDQLQFTAKSQERQLICYGSHDGSERPLNSKKGIYVQRQIHNNFGHNQHHPPVWRPQRGLPERAVTVLRSWLFEHFLHPYPTDTDKLMLAKQTGLSRNQVSNWFINARVRLWKPMVEEIHNLEKREAEKNLHREDQNAGSSRLITDHFPRSTSLVAENPSTSTQIVQDLPLKRRRNDFSNNPMGIEEPMNLMYDHSPHHQQIGVGTSARGGNSGVSLTLGLHQNNGIVLEPFPINAARRFGLDSSSQGYVIDSFQGQSRQMSLQDHNCPRGLNYVGGSNCTDFVG